MAADTRYVTHTKWTGYTPTEVTYPNGRQVTSAYDSLYRRTNVTETVGNTSIAAWQFFGPSRVATQVLGNGITCSMMNNAQSASAIQSGGTYPPAWGDKTTDRLGYDGTGRMIAKRFLPASSTTSLVGFTTQYDPSSNKLYERALHAENRSALYPTYDSMDRLRQYQRGTLTSGGGSVSTPITLPGTNNQQTYNLDGLGNWQSTVYTPEGASAITQPRTHNKLNEVTQVASTPILYDHGNNSGTTASRGNGNIVDDGTRTYAYDALNRLTTVKRKSDGAQIASYTYDVKGRRILKTTANGGVTGTVANGTSRYLQDGNQIVEELTISGGTYTTLRQFIWGMYIDELVQLKTYANTGSQALPAGVYYPLQDLLYRTTALTNASGSIVEAYDTDAYGNTLIFSGPGADGQWFTNDDVQSVQPACEYIFTGREYDPETQIYFYRARYYMPGLGRFGGRDPGAYNRTRSPFEYVASRPVLLNDPQGLQPTMTYGYGYGNMPTDLSEAGLRAWADAQSKLFVPPVTPQPSGASPATPSTVPKPAQAPTRPPCCGSIERAIPYTYGYGNMPTDFSPGGLKAWADLQLARHEAQAAAGLPPIDWDCLVDCLDHFGAKWLLGTLTVSISGMIVPKWPWQARSPFDPMRDWQSVVNAVRSLVIASGYNPDWLAGIGGATRAYAPAAAGVFTFVAGYLAGLTVSCALICRDDPCDH